MLAKQRGLSLLEVLCSLAVIAVIIAIMINYYYTQNQRSLKVTKAATQIQQIASVSYEWQAAQSQSDFSGISLPILQAAGLLSPDYNYTQVSPWGGEISVQPDPANAQYVRISLLLVPEYACTQLQELLKEVAFSQATGHNCKEGNYYISM